MAPSRVDPNRKQAKSSIDQVEEDTFCIDRMAKTVSAPSEASVHLAQRTPQDLYYECLNEGEARLFPTPNLSYKINMQTRYAAARATFTREDVVAELVLMFNPLYPIMSVAMLNYDWCLALKSVLSTSWVWPK